MYLSIIEETKKELLAIEEATRKLDEAFAELMAADKKEKDTWGRAWDSFLGNYDSEKAMIG